MRLLAGIHQLDLRAFIWFMDRPSRARCTAVSRYLSRSADGPLYVALTLLLWYWLPDFTTEQIAAVAMAFSVERLVYFCGKNSFRRHRPQEAINGFRSFIRPSDEFSFPSGHTSGAFLFAWLMTQVMPAAAFAWYGWAISVALSRIFLGVHFPTDTVVGAILGTAVAWWILGDFMV